MNADAFTPFSVVHGVVVAAVAVATTIVVALSRGLPSRQRDRRRKQIAVFIIAVQIVYQAYWLLLRRDSGESLPLHMCDIAGAVAVAAFVAPIRLFRGLLYYWGLGLSSLAFLIPVLEQGPASPEFWLFWLSHWVIVGGAVYLVAVDRFRPTWRDLGTAVALMLVYGIVTVFLNIEWGTNYMYTGDHPMPTPGDLDLAWPMPRLFAFGIAASLLMLAVHLPWIRRQGADR